LLCHTALILLTCGLILLFLLMSARNLRKMLQKRKRRKQQVPAWPCDCLVL
jgi:hypothetical protein